MNIHRLGLFSAAVTALSLAVGIATGGCSDDDKTTPTADAGSDSAADSQDTTPGKVEGNATYNGTKKGPLHVVLFANNPPDGEPGGAADNQTATWPGTNKFTVSNVDPGSYWVFSYIAVGTDHVEGPEEGDPTGEPTQVTVTAGGSTSVDLTLTDEVSDGGTDAPTDG